MANQASSVHDKFLENLISKKVPVMVFLINGVKLQGCIDACDEVALILRREQGVQLLYRQAVSTIVPQYRDEPL